MNIDNEKLDTKINLQITLKDLLLIHDGLTNLPFKSVEKLIVQLREIAQATVQKGEKPNA